ncbi:MAG: thioredoxin family protein [Pirellulales bacterium]
MYHSYFDEFDSRQRSPSVVGFANSDLSFPRLVIHFWASWNCYDRTMDARLSKINSQFQGDVRFRSVDVDRPEFRELCEQASVLSVPALGFFMAGVHVETLIGLHSFTELKAMIQNWIETPK